MSLREHLVANLFDGNDEGQVTMPVKVLVDDVVEGVAAFLSQHPDIDDVLDRSSSASRQHFVDTGRYLLHGEAETTLEPTPESETVDPPRPDFPQTPEEAITCPHGNEVWFGHECGLCGA